MGGPELLIAIPLWFIGSFLVAFVANQKGRSAFGWWALAFFLISPLFALIALAAIPSLPGRDDDDEMEDVDDERMARIRRF